MQPLLLLKQTLESSYDPGPLLLAGPILKYTSSKQFISRRRNFKAGSKIKIGFNSPSLGYEVLFSWRSDDGFQVIRNFYSVANHDDFAIDTRQSKFKLITMLRHHYEARTIL